MSVPLVDPVPLIALLGRDSTKCIGSPSPSHESCSRQVSAPTNEIQNAQKKLPGLLRILRSGVLAISKKNIQSLQAVAKAFTCSHHVQSSRDFAYHWLASSWLADFLDYMQWSLAVTDWYCLSSGAMVCTTALDCSGSMEIYRSIYAALTRLAVGVGISRSLNDIAHHWLCKDHQKEREEQLKAMRRRCEEYRSTAGFPDLSIWSSPDAKKRKSHSEESPLQRCGSLDDSMNHKDPEPNHQDIPEGRAPGYTTPPKSRSTARSDAGEGPGEDSPWNSPENFEDDTESPCQPNQNESPFSSTQSTTGPKSRYPSALQADSDDMQFYRFPGTFNPDDISAAEEMLSDSSGPNDGGLPAPGFPQTSRKNKSIPLKPTLSFKRCEDVSNETMFNEVLKSLRKGPPRQTSNTDDGYIYVFGSIDSPNNVKVGRTNQTIQQREKKVNRCAGDTLPVKNEYNICRVPQHKWLEIIILHTLKPRKCSFTCHLHKRKGCDKLMKHQEWFDADPNEIAEHVERWRQWIWSDPYDENGCLFPQWKRRIDFFETFRSRYQYLLAESSPCKAWSIFFDPPRSVRLHMAIYEQFLQRRGNLPCRWTLIRETKMQLAWNVLRGSAAMTGLLVIFGGSWVSSPLTLPLIVAVVVCRLVWQK